MNDIHVMTPDELESLPEGAVVWQERHNYKANDRVMPFVMYGGILGNYYEYLVPDELRAADDIQMHFRYWNYRPTVETMEREPWIIREEWIE